MMSVFPRPKCIVVRSSVPLGALLCLARDAPGTEVLAVLAKATSKRITQRKVVQQNKNAPVPGAEYGGNAAGKFRVQQLLR